MNPTTDRLIAEKKVNNSILVGHGNDMPSAEIIFPTSTKLMESTEATFAEIIAG